MSSATVFIWSSEQYCIIQVIYWKLLSSWLLRSRWLPRTTVLHSACLFTLAQQYLGLEALTCVDNLTMDLTRWIVMVSWMRRDNTSLVLVYIKSVVGEKRYMWFGDKVEEANWLKRITDCWFKSHVMMLILLSAYIEACILTWNRCMHYLKVATQCLLSPIAVIQQEILCQILFQDTKQSCLTSSVNQDNQESFATWASAQLVHLSSSLCSQHTRWNHACTGWIHIKDNCIYIPNKAFQVIYDY